MSLADAFVEVKPDLRKFGPDLHRGLSRVNAGPAGEAVGRQYTDGFRSGLSRMGALGLRAVGALSVAIGAAAGAAGVLGIKTAAANESAMIAFTTMLGSGQKARAFLEDMKRFAATTPFEFPELQKAASSLISIGISADKVLPIMRTLGDVTSGMGTGSEGIRRATVALQQMNAAGRITAEDLNQLRDAGVPVFDLLTAATGKTKEAISEMSRNGKLGRLELEQLMKALETGKGLERFTGLMDKQSRSLSGLWSTLKDTFGQGMAEAMAPAVPLLKDGLGGAIALVSGKMPMLVERVRGVTTWLANLKDGMQGVISLVKDGDFLGADKTFGWAEDSAAVDLLLRIRDAFKAIGGHKDAVGALMAGVVTGFTTLKSVGAVRMVFDLAKGFKAMVLAMGPIGWISLAVGALAGGLVLAYQKIEPLREAVEAVKSIVVDSWNDPNNQSTQDGLAGFFERVRKTAADAWPKIAAEIDRLRRLLWEWVKDSVPKALVALGEWVADIVAWLWQTGLPAFARGLTGWATALWEWITTPDETGKTPIENAKDALGRWLADFGRWIWEVGIPALNRIFGEWADTLWQWISTPGENGKTPLDNAKEALGRFVAGIAQWVIRDMVPTLLGSLVAARRALVQWIFDAAPEVAPALAYWMGRFTGWWLTTGIPTILKTVVMAGPKLVLWILDTIPEMRKNLSVWAVQFAVWVTTQLIPTIVRTAKAIAAEFVRGLRDALASKIYRDGVHKDGENLTNSLGQGMTYNLADKVRAWSTTIKSMIVAAIRNRFGMHSPSKVMWALGENMVDSLLAPLTSGRQRIWALINTVFGGPVAALRAYASQLAESFGGVFGGGHTLSRVWPMLLDGLSITSTYRSPAANAAAGGIPTSLHMDSSNPAVDIAGPTHLLDSMYSILQSMGGWRELLWRVPGHYDHIHVADQGALLRPGALGLNLSGRDERVLSPAQTEAFERLVQFLDSGGEGGGARTLVLVDQDGALIGRMRAEAGDVLDEELAAARWGVA